MLNREKIIMPVGEFAEGMPWSIEFDYEFEGGGVTPCQHCVNVRPAPERRRRDGTVWNEGHKSWTVPRMINALNEAGHNGTLVCLDCALEATTA